MGLRSFRTFVWAVVGLVAWGVASSVIQLVLSWDHMTGRLLLTPTVFKKAIVEAPYWPMTAIFVILCGVVADKFRHKKLTLDQFWGPNGLSESLPDLEASSFAWLCMALAVFATSMVMLDRMSSHYFLQDDNYSIFFPGILYACRTFWSGHLVSWNPYQLMGSPLTDLGLYSLTYPVTHLCYLASKAIGDETRFMDLFTWFHLTVALVGSFLLGRRLRLSAPVAAGVALCYSLSGFALLGSRSWYYMSPAFAAMPPMVILSLSFLVDKKPTARWTWAGGIILGMLFHAGNAQMWIYTVAFFILLLCAMVWKQGGALIHLTRALPLMLIMMGIVLPLLIPQMIATNGAERVSYGEGILGALPFLFLTLPNLTGTLPSNSMQVYYAGALLTAVWFAGIASLAAVKGARGVMKENPLLVASIIAFLCAAGHQGGFWTMQTLLPVFKKFSVPAKYLPFFHLFSLLVGAMLIERGIAQHNKQRLIRFGVFVVLAAFMLNHVSVSRLSFYDFADSPAYRIPSAELAALKPDNLLHRIYPASAERGYHAGFLEGMRLDFPTVAEVASFDGYEPLSKERAQWKGVLARLEAEPLATLRAYGVETIVLHRTATKEDPSPSGHYLEELKMVPEVTAVRRALTGMEPFYRTKHVELFRLPGSEAMARSVSQPTMTLPVRIAGNTVEVETASLKEGGKVLVNYLKRPGMEAWAGERRLTVTSDEFERMVVTVPAGAASIAVGYSIGWQWPALAGLICIGLGALLERRPVFGRIPVMTVTEPLPQSK